MQEAPSIAEGLAPSKPPKPLKKYKRANHQDKKIDRDLALKLYVINGLSQAEIARHFKCSNQAVSDALRDFKLILKSNGALSAFRHAEGDILDSIKLELLKDIAEPERRKKASLNNTAYAFMQVNTAKRLEAGQTTANVGLLAAIIAADGKDTPQPPTTLEAIPVLSNEIPVNAT